MHAVGTQRGGQSPVGRHQQQHAATTAQAAQPAAPAHRLGPIQVIGSPDQPGSARQSGQHRFRIGQPKRIAEQPESGQRWAAALAPPFQGARCLC